MPKAAVDKYHFLAGREYKVRAAGQIALMQAVTVAHPVNHFTYHHFRSHTLPSNCAHIRASRLRRQFIHDVASNRERGKAALMGTASQPASRTTLLSVTSRPRRAGESSASCPGHSAAITPASSCATRRACRVHRRRAVTGAACPLKSFMSMSSRLSRYRRSVYGSTRPTGGWFTAIVMIETVD